MPAAHGALVLLHHAGKKRSDQARQTRRGGQRHGARGGIALVRHGRGTAAALGGLTHFILHQERDVASDLAQRGGVDAARAHEGAQAIAVRVPRRCRVAQTQSHRRARGETSNPRLPSAASVPEAPPNCSTADSS